MRAASRSVPAGETFREALGRRDVGRDLEGLGCFRVRRCRSAQVELAALEAPAALLLAGGDLHHGEDASAAGITSTGSHAMYVCDSETKPDGVSSASIDRLEDALGERGDQPAPTTGG